MYAVKGKAWWADIGTLTYSRSYHVCVNVNNLLESQLIWLMRSFCGLCRHQHLPSNGAYSARHPLTHLRGSEQSSIIAKQSHNLHWNHFGFISLLFPFPSTHKKNEEHRITWYNSAPFAFFLFFFFFVRTNSPHLAMWVSLDFHDQFPHQGIMKI